MTRLYPAAMCVLALAFFGCAGMNEITSTRKAALDVKGKILVVPLRDAKSFYYDSHDGGAIADAAILALAAHAADKVTCVDYHAVRGLVRGAYATNEAIGWKDIGQACGADYVVYGTVDSISWEDPMAPEMAHCTFSVTYFVYDVITGKNIYGATKTGGYPATLVGDWGISASALSVQALQPRAYLYIGRVIADTFYTATVDKREDEQLHVQKHIKSQSP